MDITSHLDAYRTFTEAVDKEASIVGIIFVALSIGAFAMIGHEYGEYLKLEEDAAEQVSAGKYSLFGVLVAVLGSFFTYVMAASLGGLVIGSLMGAPDTYAAVADQVQEVYGVEVSQDQIAEAFTAGDDSVVLFSAEHSGVEKSLSMSVNLDEETLTVFDGNTELTPGEE